jgi:hypothetical protein
MKELLTEWRKFINEGAESDEFEDAVRKSVKHYYFVQKFRLYRKNDFTPPTQSSWSSIFLALEILVQRDSLHNANLKDSGKLGSYFKLPRGFDDKGREIFDLLEDIKEKIFYDLKDLIVGKRIRIEALKDSAKVYQDIEGTIVDIPTYIGGRGNREFKVEWDNESFNRSTGNIREPYGFHDMYFEVMDPPSMEEVREVIERIHPAPFEYWRKK